MYICGNCLFMNTLDIVLAVILAIGLFRGFTQGFILELFSLISVIAGIFLAYHGSGWLVDFVVSTWNWQFTQMHLLAFIFILVVVVVIFKLIGKGLTKLTDILSLGFLNRLLGALFNFVKTALILSVVINLWLWLNSIGGMGNLPFSDNSRLYPVIKNLVPRVYNIWKDQYEAPEQETPEQSV